MGLKVSITSRKPFEIASEGMHGAVLADVADKGMQPTDYGMKHKGMFVYVLDEVDTEGRPKRLFQSFTVSLHEKATLVKILGQLGAADKLPTDGSEVDLDALVLGKQIQILVTHTDDKKNPGQKRATIAAITKPALGQNIAIPSDFKRYKDQEKKA